MIITLCGSARFECEFHLWNEILTFSGHEVFSLSVFPSTKDGEKNWYTEFEKKLLDKAHLQKIDRSDAVLMLNKFAYLGPSALNELRHAKNTEKKVYALESWGKGNCIGPNHNPETREAAKHLEVYGVGSPVNTFYPHCKDVYQLLPETGKFRSSLVERIHEAELRNYGIRRD